MSAPIAKYIDGNVLFCQVNDYCNQYRDGESRIICTELTLIDCGDRDCEFIVVNNGLLLCDCADSWNCNLCGNDLPFWNIVNPGDKIYFQFQQIDVINGTNPNVTPSFGWGSQYFRGEIYECCDDRILSDATIDEFTGGLHFVGVYEQKDFKGESSFFNIQQLCIDVNIICEKLDNPDKCFYFKFYIVKGFIQKQGQQIPIFDVICTEPFKCNPCPEKKETILIESEYTNKDCFGYFYGLPVSYIGTPFNYSNEYRVRAAFEQTSFQIEKETVTRQLKAVSSQTCEVWDFKTWQVPGKVAKIIANVFAGKNVYLNGELFQLEKEIPKDNEIGSQWLIETQFKRCNCYNDFSCD